MRKFIKKEIGVALISLGIGLACIGVARADDYSVFGQGVIGNPQPSQNSWGRQERPVRPLYEAQDAYQAPRPVYQAPQNYGGYSNYEAQGVNTNGNYPIQRSHQRRNYFNR